MAFWNVRHLSLHVREGHAVYGTIPFWVDGAGLLCQPQDDPNNEVLGAVERGLFVCTGKRRPIVATDAGAHWFGRIPTVFELVQSVDPGEEAVTPASPVLRSDLLSLLARLIDEEPSEAQALRVSLRRRFGLPVVVAITEEAAAQKPGPDGLIPGVPMTHPAGAERPELPRLQPGESDPSTWVVGLSDVVPAPEPESPIPDPDNPRPRRHYNRRT